MPVLSPLLRSVPTFYAVVARFLPLLVTLGMTVLVCPALGAGLVCPDRPDPVIADGQGLAEWLKLPDRLIVDIREPASFNSRHIEGSLNLPAFGIKYDDDLKKRNLLIVGEPYQLRTVQGLITQLEERGFQRPRSLQFGVYTWRALNQPLAPEDSLPATITITPVDYLRELATPETTLFMPLSGEAVPEYLNRIGALVTIPVERSSAEVAAKLEERCLTKPCAVMADSTDQALALAQHLGAMALLRRAEGLAGGSAGVRQPLVVISGGLSALVEAIERNRAVLAQAERDREPRACR